MAERVTTLDTLRRARELLSEPNSWTQGTYARDAQGKRCYIWEDCRVCLCVEGALFSAHEDIEVCVAARDAFEGSLGGAPLDEWNDAPERTHAEVLEAFDRAIAAEERDHG